MQYLAIANSVCVKSYSKYNVLEFEFKLQLFCNSKILEIIYYIIYSTFSFYFNQKDLSRATNICTYISNKIINVSD